MAELGGFPRVRLRAAVFLAPAALGLGLICAPSQARAGVDLLTAGPWISAYQFLVSAISVSTTQRSLSSQQTAASIQSAYQASATAVIGQQTSGGVAQASQGYSYQDGQGYKSCMVAPGVAAVGSAGAQRDTFQHVLEDRSNAWFANGGSGVDTLSSLVGLRKSVYCSPAEQAAMGQFCDQATGSTHGGGYVAGNTSASVFLLNRSYGAEEAMTGLDLVDTIAPLPTVPAPGALAAAAASGGAGNANGDAGSEASGNVLGGLLSVPANGSAPATAPVLAADVAGQRFSGIYRGAFIAAARTGMEHVVLDGLQDTEPTQIVAVPDDGSSGTGP